MKAGYTLKTKQHYKKKKEKKAPAVQYMTWPKENFTLDTRLPLKSIRKFTFKVWPVTVCTKSETQ